MANIIFQAVFGILGPASCSTEEVGIATLVELDVVQLLQEQFFPPEGQQSSTNQCHARTCSQNSWQAVLSSTRKISSKISFIQSFLGSSP